MVRLRHEMGISQRDLAREFGVAPAAIASWETGARTLPGPILRLVEIYENELGIAPANDAELIPTGRLERALRNGSVLAVWQVMNTLVPPGRGGIGARVRRVVLHQLIRELGALKGLPMKLGQMVSYMNRVLPEGERAALASLTTTSRAMSAHDLVNIFVAELGHTPRQLFARWDPIPIASASIGQVHRAVTRDGRSLAIKVQHPNIAAAIDADLANLRVVDSLLSRLLPNQQRGVIAVEIGERLREECDYLHEAANLEQMGQLFAHRPELWIPRVDRSYSTRKILAMELVEGQSFEEFVATASPRQRDRATTAIWRFYFDGMLRHGLFNADAHPGNFRFVGDRVALLDFGRVKRLDPAFLATMRLTLRALFERRRDAFRRGIEDLGAVGDARQFDFDYMYKMMTGLWEAGMLDRSYTWTREFAQRNWRSVIVENPNHRSTNYTADMVFLHQIYFGMAATLGELGGSVPVRDLLLELLYGDAEARPAALPASALAD